MAAYTTITVTQEDILNGEAGTNQPCPIALAVKRALPGYAVDVGTTYITLWTVDSSVYRSSRVVLLLECRAFIDRFDAGRSVAPFSFRLPTP